MMQIFSKAAQNVYYEFWLAPNIDEDCSNRGKRSLAKMNNRGNVLLPDAFLVGYNRRVYTSALPVCAKIKRRLHSDGNLPCKLLLQYFFTQLQNLRCSLLLLPFQHNFIYRKSKTHHNKTRNPDNNPNHKVFLPGWNHGTAHTNS